MTKQPSDGSATLPRRRGRTTASIALVVIASVLLPLAGATVWVRNLVLDSARYVDTVAPLSSNPAVREAVATRVERGGCDRHRHRTPSA